MKARILINFSVALILSIISSCSSESPKSVLGRYLDAKFSSNYELSYTALSSADKSVKSLEEYLEENGSAESAGLSKSFSGKSTYKIISVTQEDTKAFAVVELTVPDVMKITGELMGSLLSNFLDKGFDEQKFEAMIEEKYADFPMITEIDTIQLVKENEGWHIFLDWETEGKIEKLLSDAKELIDAKELYGAIEKYENILKLNPNMAEAQTGLEETKKVVKEFEEKQAYIDFIDLYDLQAKYYDTFLDGRVPGITFKLKNNGDRTLKNVEVTVYFKGVDGEIIFEEDFFPISEYSFDNNKPLKPNYVWSIGSGKFYKAEKVPSEWKPGSVSAKITDIEFE